MAEDFGLESQMNTVKLWETFICLNLFKHSHTRSNQTFVWHNMNKNGNWQLSVRSKPCASAFLPLFSKFMYLQCEHSSGHHAGTSAPLWTPRHHWQRRLKPCLHVISPSFRALNPHPRLFPNLNTETLNKKGPCSPHQWGVRDGTIK